MERFDAIVIGAGAAGLMAAITAGQRGRRVLLLDHAEEPGKKILISGGGRCNFTNLGVEPARFLSRNPHFCRAALARYTQQDFIALVAKHRIPFHEKTLGQLFCDGSARAIVAMLLAEASAAGVDLRAAHRVTEVTRAEAFQVVTDRGDFAAPALVLATGGLSIPKMGATGFAHDLARRFGLPLVTPAPGLVPLTFEGEDLALMRPLAGVALDVVATAGRSRFREAMLFTHRGLSGPAILQASSYWQPGEAITLDLLPGRDAAALLLSAKQARPRAEPRTALAELLPQRLAAVLAEAHLPPRIMAEQPDRALRALAERLARWPLTPSGTEGYAKAEVTLGGIDTDALSQRDMQAKAVPGLFVVGEAVDVTGWLGGYNFQWAWSSGFVAGQAL
ncbi:BaiN/RdsA family NAD(P)/FAD-dependent oxidoreductase [Plastoroseomonas hellenica]|uniref:NAD(P)/FAD-dependent oxidoreductase n=1 Tax=Plastoroseomonas hellenica TaxID=2687306 RepID=UPI001BA5ABA6|nr:NAD(P)/FAD-dependent oxidoreductase [Plastoroseomonas hellenica]